VVPGPTGLPAVVMFLLADAPIAELAVDAGLVLAAGVFLDPGIGSRRTWFKADSREGNPAAYSASRSIPAAIQCCFALVLGC
jgi:hypothetical protein